MTRIFKKFRNEYFHFSNRSSMDKGEQRRLCRLEALEDRTMLSAVGITSNPIPDTGPEENTAAIIQPYNLNNPIPSVYISTANNSGSSFFTVDEGDDLELVLTRDSTEGSVTVYYEIQSYSSSCRAGDDFNSTASYANPGSVTFADGSSTATLSISTIDDNYIENPEEFYLSLIYYPSYYDCAYTLNYSECTNVYCTITDNDDWTVSVTQTGNSMYEMNGTASNGNDYSTNNPKFTISHTGITDPNDEYAPELKVYFNLSGTASSDDYDLCRNGGSWSKYYDQLNEFSFNGAQSFDLYINPYNHYCDPEEDETIILTLITNPNSWGDAGTDYTISGTASQTITILDDDHFDVILEAVDTTATERLDGVTPDDGLFKISRVASNGRTVLDTSYALNMEFYAYDMSEEGALIPNTTLYAARDSYDFNFRTTAADSTDATDYLFSFTNNGNWSIYDEDGDFLYWQDRYSGTLAAGKSEGYVRVDPTFDWEDEGDLFSGTDLEDAFTQTGETVRLTLEKATWGYGSQRTWTAGTAGKTADIEIKDGAICKLLTDINNDGSITAADDPRVEDNDSIGTVIRHNNDDDDLDGIADYMIPEDYTYPQFNSAALSAYPVLNAEHENDLKIAKMQVGIESMAPGMEAEVYFSDYNLNVWTESTKGNLLVSANMSGNHATAATVLTYLSDENLTFSQDVYVEATSAVYPYIQLYTNVFSADDELLPSTFVTRDFTTFTLDAYTPDTTYIDPMVLPDAVWDGDGKSVGIRRNLDNDIGNIENDFIKFNLNHYSVYQCYVERSSSNLKLWYSETGAEGTEYNFNSDNEVQIGNGDFWVEYHPENTSDSDQILTLTFSLRSGDDIVYEKVVNFSPFNGITIAFVGEFQHAGNRDFSPGLNDWVYLQLLAGYDVHVWDDGCDIQVYKDDEAIYNQYGAYNNYAVDCYFHGEGRAFDELCLAINERGQTNIAIIGYSHGGGSAYNLANRLFYDGQVDPTSQIGYSNRIEKDFNILFTSYIDAVQHNMHHSTAPETRRPLGTQYHLNQYQTNSFLHGDITSGNDINTENFLYSELDHSTITRNLIVLLELKDSFQTHMVR